MPNIGEDLTFSLIVRSVVTVMIVLLVVYLVAFDQNVPELVTYMASTVLGFWFGVENQKIRHENRIQRLEKTMQENV